jgi:hypothetical protein
MNNANMYMQSAAGYGQAAGQSRGRGLSAIGKGIGDLFGGLF